MRTSLSPETAAAADTFKSDVRNMADDAMKAAREHVVDPAVEAAGRARTYATDAMHNAQDRALHAMHEAQERLSREYSRAERYASETYSTTERWVSAHPFKAIGIALGVGLAISTLFDTSHSRR